MLIPFSTKTYFTTSTLSSPAKKWLADRISAAVTLAPHPPPQFWLLTGLILMTHTTFTILESSDKSEHDKILSVAGQQAPFDPTGVSAIRRSSVSEHVKPVFGLDDAVSSGDGDKGREVANGIKIVETGKYPGTRGWAARWQEIGVKVVGSSKATGGEGELQLRGEKVAVVEIEAGEFAEDGDEVGEEDGYDEAYWDQLLEIADDD
jgi:hypothetical protein